MTPTERARLELAGENWLQHVVNRTAAESGYQRSFKAEANGYVC